MILYPITTERYLDFYRLLNEYYRDGEDADTPQEQLERFIGYLFERCIAGEIFGCIAVEESPIGFALWNVDSAESPFSNKPGYGTILEIGVSADCRGRGMGVQLVRYAESAMDVSQYYVCAYGPAEQFWKKCGYADSGELAENGLKLMTKNCYPEKKE